MGRTIESIELIYRDPAVRGGRPCIVGTGLRVMDIVCHQRYAHRTPEQIAAGLRVRLDEVHAALAYYELHRDEIDADIREHIDTLEQMKAEGIGRPENPIAL